jgi:hypothetical protein
MRSGRRLISTGWEPSESRLTRSFMALLLARIGLSEEWYRGGRHGPRRGGGGCMVVRARARSRGPGRVRSEKEIEPVICNLVMTCF